MTSEVIPGKKRWGNQERISAAQVRVGGLFLGRCVVEMRMQYQDSDEYRTYFPDGRVFYTMKGMGLAVGWDIRIRAAKWVRDSLGGTTGPLEFWTPNPRNEEHPWIHYEYSRVTWRSTCCKILGWTENDPDAEHQWRWQTTDVPPPE